MRWTEKGTLAAVVAAVVVGLAPQALAECPGGDSRFIGNIDGASTIQWNLDDPSADFSYFFVEAPTVNEGTFDFRANFLNLKEFGSTIDEAFSSGTDIGALGSGTNGCPASGQRIVALFTDRRGTTCISVVDAADVQWDFGKAAGGSRETSPITGGPVIPRSEFQVRVVGNSRAADGTANVTVSWGRPSCNTDASFELNVSGYDLYRLVLPHGTQPDSGQGAPERIMSGLTTNTTTVNLPGTPGADTYLLVGANLGTSGRASMSGASAPITTDPALAFPTGPGKGKGKGLEKAPGQNR
jgi:hypothetical protein